MEDMSNRLGWTLNMRDCLCVASTHSFLESSMLLYRGNETRWNNWFPIKLIIILEWVSLLGIRARERLSGKGILVETIMDPIYLLLVEMVDHIYGSRLLFNRVFRFLTFISLWSLIFWRVQFN